MDPIREKTGQRSDTKQKSTTRRTQEDRSLNRERLPLKSRVYGLTIDGTSKAWSLDKQTSAQVLNGTLSDASLVPVATRASVLVRTKAETPYRYMKLVEYDTGSGVHVYDSGERVFTKSNGSAYTCG